MSLKLKEQKKELLIKIASEVYNDLDSHSGKTGLSKSAIINLAIFEFLEKFKKSNSEWVRGSNYYNSVSWDRSLDKKIQLLEKGATVFCEGEIENKEVEQGGTKRRFTNFNIKKIKKVESPTVSQ